MIILFALEIFESASTSQVLEGIDGCITVLKLYIKLMESSSVYFGHSAVLRIVCSRI